MPYFVSRAAFDDFDQRKGPQRHIEQARLGRNEQKYERVQNSSKTATITTSKGRMGREELTRRSE